MGTYGPRVPASRVGHVPDAQGGLPPGPHALRTGCAYQPWAFGTYRAPWLSPQVAHALGECSATELDGTAAINTVAALPPARGLTNAIEAIKSKLSDE